MSCRSDILLRFKLTKVVFWYILPSKQVFAILVFGYLPYTIVTSDFGMASQGGTNRLSPPNSH